MPEKLKFKGGSNIKSDNSLYKIHTAKITNTIITFSIFKNAIVPPLVPCPLPPFPWILSVSKSLLKYILI